MDPIDELVAAAQEVIDSHDLEKPPRYTWLGGAGERCPLHPLAVESQLTVWTHRRQAARERLREALLNVESARRVRLTG